MRYIRRAIVGRSCLSPIAPTSLSLANTLIAPGLSERVRQEYSSVWIVEGKFSMKREDKSASENTEKPSVTLSGTVEKVIPSLHPSLPEKAQIAVEEADHMYRELRIENSLHDDKGNPVSLKPGAEVDVTIEADSNGTTPKKKDAPEKKAPA